MQEVQVLPWEKIAWSDEHVQILYRDWGLFYTHKQQLDIAANYYNKSLELKDDDSRALYFRSQCKRSIAQTQGALEDGLAAGAIEPNNAPINLEICDALYELNQFENCKMELHDNTHVFYGNKVAAFENRLVVVNENFNDSIGETLGPFIMRNEKIFEKVLHYLERRKYVDPRPLWKILREQGKCDVLSMLEKEEVLLSPREVARRERAFKVFNQIYYNKSWIDVLFLKDLRENPHLLLPQCKVSTPFLRHLAHTKYEVLKKFLKMLQARSPLYNEQMRKCPDKTVWEKHREAHLNHIQYQTRRNMLTILRTIRQMRAKGKIDKLSKYVEEVMGDYVVLKTHRVMPWKFEFLNEVYNTLALAYIDRYIERINSQPVHFNKNRLLHLLRIPTDKNKDRAVSFVFGDKSTYQEPDATDYTMIAYKKYLARLEKRIHFSKYSIEKCYLLHEIARSHLKQNRVDECSSVGRKAVEETKNCNSNVWRFLSTLLICKAQAVLHKVERTKEILDEAYAVAKILNSPDLIYFVDSCRQMNDAEISMKKRTQSMESVRRRRSKASLESRLSQVSQPSDGTDESTQQQVQE
ncbi:uncharacterized protein LOC129239244 [Anastrepha obliqua]|uniref:uncharacterized protein LOC129239244 n=1 Tax=Anastrepha obliqua TaxID=95512 RepID=UPI002408F850|nr:uncharacterized protein LOC129239244 [Anastrepha obliqua]